MYDVRSWHTRGNNIKLSPQFTIVVDRGNGMLHRSAILLYFVYNDDITLYIYSCIKEWHGCETHLVLVIGPQRKPESIFEI